MLLIHIKKTFSSILIANLALLSTEVAYANEDTPQPLSAVSQQSSTESHDKVLYMKNALKKLGVKIASSYVSPISEAGGFTTLLTNGGMIQVNYEQELIVYQNNLFKLDSNGDLVSHNAKVTRAYLDDLSYKIVAKSPNEKYRIQAFVDIACPHCRAFFQRLPQALNDGITVEFILFSGGGDKQPSFVAMSSIFEEDDQLSALTNMMNGMAPSSMPKQPSLQMVLHQQAAIAIGVQGTPGLYFKGLNIPNVSLDKMLPMLEKFNSNYTEGYDAKRVD